MDDGADAARAADTTVASIDTKVAAHLERAGLGAPRRQWGVRQSVQHCLIPPDVATMVMEKDILPVTL